MESNATVNIELFKNNESLTLFNDRGNPLDTSDNNVLNFSNKAGETFFLKLGNEAEITTPVIDDYEIALNVVDTSIFDDIAGFINDLYVLGTKNDDTLIGSSKNEILLGYDGNDIIYGRDGDDTLTGGLGSDTLYDEAGNDIFYYSNVNQSLPGNLKDSVGLDVGEDRIELSDINADIKDSGDQSFDFIGTSRFTSGSTGQVRYDASNNLIQVELGGDGDTIVDMEIASHKDFSSLSSRDFML